VRAGKLHDKVYYTFRDSIGRFPNPAEKELIISKLLLGFTGIPTLELCSFA